MTREHDDYQSDTSPPAYRPPSWRRWAWLAGGAFGGLLTLVLVWNWFFVYVRPGEHLIIISKHGKELPPGEVLAKEDYKGIREEVKGEGWHFVWPIIYATEKRKNTVVPPGQVGIVTAPARTAPAEGQ